MKMNKVISKNFIIPVFGIYFAGVFVGGNAVANCYFGQDFNLALYTIAIFVFTLSMIVLFEKKENGGSLMTLVQQVRTHHPDYWEQGGGRADNRILGKAKALLPYSTKKEATK